MQFNLKKSKHIYLNLGTRYKKGTVLYQRSVKHLLSGIFFLLLFTGCSKQQLDDYSQRVVSFRTYLPTKSGDIHYYTLDSIVPAAFGASLDTIHYFIKDSIGDPSIHNKDTSYPVYRYQTQLSLKNPWQYQMTYSLVFSPHTAALIDEHSRRFIILTDPVRQDYSWEGNRYFSSDLNLGDFYYGWAYSYDLNAGDNLLTVHQTDQTNGNPGDFDPSLYQERSFAEMQFTQEVGLNRQEVLHITYQANQNNPSVFGYYEQDSYGIILQRITP